MMIPNKESDEHEIEYPLGMVTYYDISPQETPQRPDGNHNQAILGLSPASLATQHHSDDFPQAIVNIEEVYIQNENQEYNQSYYCYICMESINITPDTSIVPLACGHKFCHECFTGYLRSKIADGQVNLHCFNPIIPIEPGVDHHIVNSISQTTNACNYCISYAEISNALKEDPDTMMKYDRFTRLKGDSKTRECCYCNHIQVGDPNAPMMVCTSCNESYCYFHANAHDSEETCEAYEARIKDSQQNSIEFISSFAKLCPKCGIAIGKTDGCNHMKCTVCNQAFCWICGKAIDDTVFPAHFQWWNPYGCSNLQMNDSITPSRFALWSARILTCLEIIILGPLTLASTIASFVLCSCCLPHYLMVEDKTEGTLFSKFSRLGAHCLSGWGMFWIAIIFFLPAVFILLGLIIGFGAAAFALIYPVYAIFRVCSGEYPWPSVVTSFFKTCFDRIYLGCIRMRHICCFAAPPTSSSNHPVINSSPSTATRPASLSTDAVMSASGRLVSSRYSYRGRAGEASPRDANSNVSSPSQHESIIASSLADSSNNRLDLSPNNATIAVEVTGPDAV